MMIFLLMMIAPRDAHHNDHCVDDEDYVYVAVVFMLVLLMLLSTSIIIIIVGFKTYLMKNICPLQVYFAKSIMYNIPEVTPLEQRTLEWKNG